MSVQDLLSEEEMMIFVRPILDPSVRGLCVRPYPRHPRGCPNHGKKKGCPPGAPLFQDVYDLSRPVLAVWNIFDLGSHVERMRAKHPGWSWAQLTCCLYWQGTARKRLATELERAMIGHFGMCAETCPEAMGVDVTKTMRSVGVELEWPPATKTVQVALLAYLKTH